MALNFALPRRFMKFLVFKFKPAQIESMFYSAKIPQSVKFKQAKFVPSARPLQ